MPRIRVLVAEDSKTVRQRLIDVISADSGMQVVGEAVDGQQAADLCRLLRPDVLTLDLAMPAMDGLAVTEHVMAHFPTPILIISGSFERGEMLKTYDALAAGAIEVIEKPRGDEVGDSWERSLLAMVRMVARIKVITHLRGRLTERKLLRSSSGPAPASPARLVAIGTSTGGPAALAQVLGALPAEFPWPILVVIHLSAAFAGPFQLWLSGQTCLPVVLATHGQALGSASGKVMIAPADCHLTVQAGMLQLGMGAPLHSCRPSVDVLFHSLAGQQPRQVIACLLTGMGRDGAQGLLAIRRAGGHTVAEHESTSVVYGMPREAVLLDAADCVLPLPEIAGHLARLADTGTREVRR